MNPYPWWWKSLRNPESFWNTARSSPYSFARWDSRTWSAKSQQKGASVILELNHYVFLFLIVGLLLHWRPRSFGKAIAASVPSVAGVLIQYPLYAGIVKIMTESGLASKFAHFFVAVSSRDTFPILVGIYSAFLGLFIPSAGGKWLIEAPYILEASKSLQVHLGWTVQTYNATEALANLIHPFWMLPLIGILRIESPRYRWLLDVAVCGSRPGGAVSGVDPELHAGRMSRR